jgi:TonB family protein
VDASAHKSNVFRFFNYKRTIAALTSVSTQRVYGGAIKRIWSYHRATTIGSCKTQSLIVIERHIPDVKGPSRIMIANSSRYIIRLLKLMFFVLIGALLWNTLAVPGAASQSAQIQSTSRKVKLSVPPEYPELARKMNIQGIARVLLTVTSDGRVIGVKELGGNPVLVSALVQAVKKWKYETADRESEIEVRFEFIQNR